MITQYDLDPLLQDGALKKECVVVRVEEFDPSSAAQFTDNVNKALDTGQPVVPVVIDSYGGQVYSLLSMVETIERCPIPVATIIMGKAMSCGMMLAAFGSKNMRYCSPHATLMLHEVSAGAGGKFSEMEQTTENIKRINRKLFRMLAARCGKPQDYYSDRIYSRRNTDWYMSPKKARKVGLIDHVKVPTMTVKAKVEFSLK